MSIDTCADMCVDMCVYLWTFVSTCVSTLGFWVIGKYSLRHNSLSFVATHYIIILCDTIHYHSLQHMLVIRCDTIHYHSLLH